MWTSVDSPVGPLRVVTTPGAGDALAAVEFDPWGATTNGRPVGERADEQPVLRAAREQLDAYFAGTLDTFDLPLAPVGTPFQQRVWSELARVPLGETTSYGALALTLGLTGHGARAVGLANGRNPLPVVVPCHRVVGADGRLTGYAGGLERKQWLLAHEQHALF